MEYKVIRKSKMLDPLVSIIVPMYNVQEYIEETLDSIFNQTMSNFELLLIDDGSTDDTINKVKSITEKYEQVTLIAKGNSGPGASRNLGLDLATGEFINFVDSDDILPIDALESLYTAAKEKEADLVTGMSQSFNSERKWFIASHLKNGAYDEGIKDLFNNPEMLYTLGPCNKMFKRELIRDIRFPAGIKVTEDHPFVIHAYLKAKRIYTLDKVIYFYRQREDITNISLSQIVNVNSSKVIKDIFNSLKCSDSLWEAYEENPYKRNAMKESYYNRIIKADLWPAINKSIRARNKGDQEEVFGVFFQWVKEMDDHLFNRLPLISHIITFQSLNRYLLLSANTKKLHMALLKLCFEKLYPDVLNTLLVGSKGKEIACMLSAAKKSNPFPMYWFLAKRSIKRKRKRLMKTVGLKISKQLVFNISKLLPMSKKKVIFATNKDTKFSGSFKSVFDELTSLNDDYSVKGYFKNNNRTIKEMSKLYYDLATAKYIILDDYYSQLYGLKTRSKTEVIQLWHAAGAFKKFGFSSIGSLDSNTYDFEQNAHQNYTKVVVSGNEVSSHYAEAFNVPLKRVYPLGVPRTDIFLDEDYKNYVRDLYENKYPSIRNKKIITYAPTFRGRPGKRATFNLELDLERLHQELGKDYILILKLHPSVTKGVHIPKIYQDFVINMSKNDVNDVLIVTDILITDYSSIVFDYSLLVRPMIFFAYDLDSYLDERGFYYKYEEFIPGPIVQTTDGIIDIIKSQEFDMETVKTFAAKYFDDLDGNSGKRVVETVFK